jgi:hypothetical protein
MKTRVLFLLFAFIILLPFSTNAQFGGVVRRAVNRQINNEIDSALDKKVQDEQNKNRAKEKAAQQQQAEQAAANPNASNDSQNKQGAVDSGNGESGAAGGSAMSGLFGNKVTSKYNDEYKFTSRIYMISETYDKDEVMKMDFYMFYSESSPVLGVETNTITDENSVPAQAKMVMDGENKTFIILSDVNGMKMGMISEIPEENSTVIGPDGKPVKNYTPPTFTKTGNSREIAGYKCDEYTYKDEKEKTSGKVWFTKDAKLKIDKRGWNNSNMSYYYGSPVFKDGIILASEANDSKGKLQMKSETKEINENFPHAISVTGYTLRQMNSNKK